MIYIFKFLSLGKFIDLHKLSSYIEVYKSKGIERTFFQFSCFRYNFFGDLHWTFYKSIFQFLPINAIKKLTLFDLLNTPVLYSFLEGTIQYSLDERRESR
jgi:hypothetical protein